MADKLLVGVGAHGATVARWRNRLVDCHEFANDDAGHAAFKEYLAATPDIPAYILIDAVEEDYRFETLPHAYGSDRAQMSARKLRQHYRNTPYLTAWRLGRDTRNPPDHPFPFSPPPHPPLAPPSPDPPPP